MSDDLAEFTAAIRHLNNVLAGLPDGDPARPQLLNDLGNAGSHTSSM